MRSYNALWETSLEPKPSPQQIGTPDSNHSIRKPQWESHASPEEDTCRFLSEILAIRGKRV